MTGWGSRARRRAFAATVFSAVLAGALAPAEANHLPSVKLIGVEGEQTNFVRPRRSRPVRLNVGALVASVGGAFELRATRDETYGPITFRQVDAHDPDTVHRSLDADLMRGPWFGLADFFEVTVKDRAAVPNTMFSTTIDWCPNGFSHERTSDGGPITPTYPRGCSGHPFTLGTVWGVDAGWAVEAFEDVAFAAPDGTYDVTFAIADGYRTVFEISDDDAEVESSITVKTKRRRRARSGDPSAPRTQRSTVTQASHIAPPDDDTPDPAWLPDLRALPAWAVGTDREEGKDLVTFAATEWNAGPQPMVIEGFRPDTAQPTMQAYQYFYENGQPVARDEAGELIFETHEDHAHWHFEQFVIYELLDDNGGPLDGQVVATSGKQAWCLVPNAQIDLTVPGANWRPGNTDLSTACGGKRSLWVREVLDAGHGDTYFQFSGEAFDVTGLSDGDYQIRITVNPVSAFHETTTANNASLRDITLGTAASGQRTAQADPYPAPGGISD